MVAQGGSWIRMPTGLGGTPGQISGVSENAAYILTSTTEQITLCTAAKDEGDVFKDGDKRNGSCRLQSRIRSSGDSWVNVGKTTTVAGPYLKPNTVCTNGLVVSSSMAVTTAPSSGIPSGYIESGRQHEDANRLDFDAECDEGWVEVHFALAMGTGTDDDTTYEFRAKWWNDNSSVYNAVISPTLKSTSSSVGGSDHYLVDSPGATEVTERGSITAVQDLDLSDALADVTVTSVSQISASQALELTDGTEPVLVTSVSQISSVQGLPLASTDGTIVITPVASITATQELLLDDEPPAVAVTVVAAVTATQLFALEDEPLVSVRMDATGELTATQVLALEDEPLVSVRMDATGELTATQVLALEDGPTAVGMATTGLLTVAQTLPLANTPPDVAVTSVSQISSVQVRELSDDGQTAVAMTNTGELTATQVLALTDEPTAVAMTLQGELTALQVLALTDEPPAVAMTNTGELTAIQVLALTDEPPAVAMVLQGGLTATQVLALADEPPISVRMAPTGVLTSTGALLLTDEPPAVSMTLQGDLTAIQVLALTDEPPAVSMTLQGELTAIQVLALEDEPPAVAMTNTGELTAIQVLALTDEPPAVAMTLQGDLTAAQVLALEDEPPAVAMTASGGLTVTQTLPLANTPPAVAMTSSGSIATDQVHLLTHAPPEVGLTSTGVLVSTSDTLLAGESDPVAMTTTGQLTAIQVLALTDEPPGVEVTSTGELAATQLWGIEDDPTPVSVTASGGITSAKTIPLDSSALIVVFPGVSQITSSVVGGTWPLRGASSIQFDEKGLGPTSVQTYSLSDTPDFVITKGEASISSVRHWYLIDDADPILIQPLTGFPYGPYISAATHILSVTIDGIGDLDRSTNRGGVLSQRRNLFLKRSEYMAVEDIWNIGLTQLGVGQVTGQVDGTAQAKLIDAVWNDFRQQFISDHAWNGCKTTAVLTALVDSDFQDSTRWSNVFSLPSDYIRALALNGHPNQPKSSEDVQWEIEIVANTNDVKTRCLVTNQATAKLEYVFDVGDAYIHLLSPAMRHAAGLGLAAFVGANFGKSASEIALIEQKYREALLKAKGIDGQESSGRYFSSTALVDVRYRG